MGRGFVGALADTLLLADLTLMLAQLHPGAAAEAYFFHSSILGQPTTCTYYLLPGWRFDRLAKGLQAGNK